MTNIALFLLPVLFLGGICGILHSLSRRAVPLPPLPTLEERRAGSVVPAQHRRESSTAPGAPAPGTGRHARRPGPTAETS